MLWDLVEQPLMKLRFISDLPPPDHSTFPSTSSPHQGEPQPGGLLPTQCMGRAAPHRGGEQAVRVPPHPSAQGSPTGTAAQGLLAPRKVSGCSWQGHWPSLAALQGCGHGHRKVSPLATPQPSGRLSMPRLKLLRTPSPGTWSGHSAAGWTHSGQLLLLQAGPRLRVCAHRALPSSVPPSQAASCSGEHPAAQTAAMASKPWQGQGKPTAA